MTERDGMKRAYLPCHCWCAEHFVCIDTDEDIPGELNISVMSSRNGSLWHRLRWAAKHVFGREDLVFADLIINRAELHRAISDD